MTSTPIDLLIGRLISFVDYEATALAAARDEVEKIKGELEFMKGFLIDIDNIGARGEVEKTWVAKVRDIAEDVQDIIDGFTYHMNKQQGWNMIKQILFIFDTLWERYKVAKKLQQIHVRIKQVSERNDRYNRTNDLHPREAASPSDRIKNYGEVSGYIQEDDLVGLSDAKHKLMSWLLDGESQRTIIKIVGMGGSGKTTLAAHLFNSQPVKLHFECCSWITVSQSYKVENLLTNMIKQFNKALKKEIPCNFADLSYRELLEYLKTFLLPMRYLVVLDDVWNINLWREIQVALPNSSKGSRVLLTTRKEDLANHISGLGSYIYHVKPLEGDLAWHLFCRKAFVGTPDKICPRELQCVGKNLVQKCKGLPLGIVTLGAVMSAKTKDNSEWEKVYNGLNWELRNNPLLEVVMAILLLSFKDLPYRLKQCFLYCCIFPEDYVIQQSKLVRLWIAEGFVEQFQGLSLEETAESYLVELVHRSLLQVAERHPNGKPKACQMHDLFRELAISISEEEKFCTVITTQDGTIKDSRVRRLSLQALNEQILNKDFSKVRTLFIFPPRAASSITIPSGFRMLTVLDFQDIPIIQLPEEVTDCFNSRYLNLKGTKLKQLPKSIGKLQSLQYLDIRSTEIKKLHRTISKMKSLRHLLMYRFYSEGNLNFESVSGTQAPLEACEFQNLQVLDCVEVESEVTLKGLEYTTQLTKLGLTNVRKAYEDKLCSSIEGMKLLRHLFLKTADMDELLCIDALSTVPPLLSTLWLIGKLEKLPRWFNSLQNIACIHLQWSRLTEEFLPPLQDLPNLARLYLINTYIGTKLHFQSGFKKLTYFEMRLFPQLKEIVIEKGVMPCLQELNIDSCRELKTLPSGIEHLSSLQELSLWNMTTEFLNRIRGKRAVDRRKIQHISKIGLYKQTETGSWVYESLS